MIINYERITKNLVRFVLDLFNKERIENEKNKQTFEHFNNNLRDYPFELLLDNGIVERINYFGDIPFSKTIIRENDRVIKITIKSDNLNISKNIEYLKNKIKVGYESSNG